MVIFNLQPLDRALHRLLLKAVDLLGGLDVNIVAAFLFLDPSRSPYYLESDRPRGAFPIKKLFGPELSACAWARTFSPSRPPLSPRSTSPSCPGCWKTSRP